MILPWSMIQPSTWADTYKLPSDDWFALVKIFFLAKSEIHFALQNVIIQAQPILLDTTIKLACTYGLAWNNSGARKIFEFHLFRWGSINPRSLLARGTSPLARVFKLVNNSWTQEWMSNYRRSPLSADHFHVYSIILQYFNRF